MPESPNIIKANLDKVVGAWGRLRPAKSFGGMTLEQFKAKVQPSYDARTTIANLEADMTAALDQRDNADVVSSAELQKVIKGVVGDPTEGDDGELYEAMGYVRKSERASGLTKKKAAAANPA